MYVAFHGSLPTHTHTHSHAPRQVMKVYHCISDKHFCARPGYHRTENQKKKKEATIKMSQHNLSLSRNDVKPTTGVMSRFQAGST